MIELYFTKGFGILDNAELLGTYETVEECNSAMKVALDKYGIKPMYYRVCNYDTGIVIDYGSHYKFYLIRGISYEDYILNREEKSSQLISKHTFGLQVSLEDPNEIITSQKVLDEIIKWCTETLKSGLGAYDNVKIKII